MNPKLKVILVAAALAASSAAAIGQTREEGQAEASWEGGQWGEMSERYRYDPGMMGGYGRGPGMMGGYGSGPGMMGGYHGGPGMGGFLLAPGSPVDLTEEQRQRIKQISDAERKQHWAVMGNMMDEQNKLRDLLEQPTPDPKAVGAAYGSISKLHQQMLESHLQARNEVHGILTPEQREQLEELRSQGVRRDGGGRGGYYGRGMRRR